METSGDGTTSENERDDPDVRDSSQENPETIAELLQFGSKFYRYHVRNTMLIYQQNPHATYVQSYKAWKEMGYSPKEGVRRMKVFVPVKTTWLELEAGDGCN